MDSTTLFTYFSGQLPITADVVTNIFNQEEGLYQISADDIGETEIFLLESFRKDLHLAIACEIGRFDTGEFVFDLITRNKKIHWGYSEDEHETLIVEIRKIEALDFNTLVVGRIWRRLCDSTFYNLEQRNIVDLNRCPYCIGLHLGKSSSSLFCSDICKKQALNEEPATAIWEEKKIRLELWDIVSEHNMCDECETLLLTTPADEHLDFNEPPKLYRCDDCGQLTQLLPLREHALKLLNDRSGVDHHRIQEDPKPLT